MFHNSRAVWREHRAQLEHQGQHLLVNLISQAHNHECVAMAASKRSTSIIQCQLKLKLRPTQERLLGRWLWRLSGAYNWAIRKIDLDARHGIWHPKRGLEALVRGHGAKIGVPTHVLQATVATAVMSWRRCFDGVSKRPRLKSHRNRLNSIPFPDPFRPPVGSSIVVLGLGRARFHAQDIPAGRIKCGRIVRRASGWHLCLFIEASPVVVPATAHGEIGIDPGFSALLTLSTGDKLDHPRELQSTAHRLAQAQRGGNRRLVAKLQERQTNQRKDRNHKLSRRLVGENALIVWSKDQHQSIARRFGKSVASAAHGQLRQMLAYKCRAGGRAFVEVPSQNSTRTCSACGALTGPTGWRGLSVRQWTCGCGAEHDRDVNAAVNTLIVGRGMRHERACEGSSEIAA